jgi:hypothetical protein
MRSMRAVRGSLPRAPLQTRVTRRRRAGNSQLACQGEGLVRGPITHSFESV